MNGTRLILRYRDFAPEVDTISAHNAMLQKHGSALWGWWKKLHEPDQLADLLDLELREPIPILLLNRFDGTAYTTMCSEILRTARWNSKFIPPYYRREAGAVHGWFRLIASIESAPYDEALAISLGEHTLRIDRVEEDEGTNNYVLVDEADSVTKVDAVAAKIDDISLRDILPSSIRILHLSDLHLNPDDHNFAFPGITGIESAQVSLAEAIYNDYHKNFDGKPDLVVLSGDITSKASWDEPLISHIVDEIKKLSNIIGVELANFVVCPGNHDFNRPPPDRIGDIANLVIKDATSFAHEKDFRFFRNRLLNIPVDEPLSTVIIRDCEDFVLKLGILNSANLTATQFVEYGFVGDHLNGVLREMRGGEKDAYKALVLHHHLLPISPIEEPKAVGVSITLDSHSILTRAQQEGVQLVLHGHQHIPKIVKTAQAWERRGEWQGLGEDIYVLASGSAGSKSLPGGVANTYSIIDFSRQGVTVSCRRIERYGGVGAEEFAINLPIVARTAVPA